jgi:pseudouridine kinase
MPDVVVIGGANIDIKAKAIVHHRLGTSNPGIVTQTPGGVARNISHNLARLGAKVSLISAVGDDVHGDQLLRQTQLVGVDVASVRREHIATGTYIALIDEHGELVSAVSDMRILDLLTPDVIRENARKLAEAKYVLADCNLPLDSLVAIADICGEKLAIETVSVQKSKKLFALLKSHKVFVATPNLDQIESLTGSRDIGVGIESLHAKGLINVVVHAGSEGAFVSDGASIDHAEPRPAGEIVDVTGAGDAAMAGLLYGLLQGESLLNAARLGQEAAGRVIASTRSTLE